MDSRMGKIKEITKRLVEELFFPKTLYFFPNFFSPPQNPQLFSPNPLFFSPMFDASPSTILYCIAVDGPQLHRRKQQPKISLCRSLRQNQKVLVNWMLFFRF
ncbi:hypothetical protein E1A91_A07G202500v1 [Gossypium mustelinum]|uniref:Uncharacterized protein n=1 Tax=Gossypium mustelinum TaxID=34275 RepID=A0A5D2YMV8_GOSMU|nr:hypothetical protein E1A91_A07G202500v1 [Gossypium mustelinum]